MPQSVLLNLKFQFYRSKIQWTQNLIAYCVSFKGVIIDHEYLGDQYEPTLEKVKEVIERVIREDLRGAGLNVKYFSWSRINFNKGCKAVRLVSCVKTNRNQIKNFGFFFSFQIRSHGHFFNSQLCKYLGNIWTCTKRTITFDFNYRPGLPTFTTS